jgi:hypothetical protein
MTVTENQIDKKKTKRVGRVGENPVFEMVTKGGLHMLVVTSTASETLGVGSHRAVARHIAGQNANQIEWSELSKADHVEVEHFADKLPKYTALTAQIRAAEAREVGGHRHVLEEDAEIIVRKLHESSTEGAPTGRAHQAPPRGESPKQVLASQAPQQP